MAETIGLKEKGLEDSSIISCGMESRLVSIVLMVPPDMPPDKLCIVVDFPTKRSGEVVRRVFAER